MEDVIGETQNGGTLTAGLTKSYGGNDSDGYVVKYNKKGETEWRSVIGGSESDEALAVKELESGRFVAVGVSESFGSSSKDGFISKLDTSGNVQWLKTLGAPSDLDNFQTVTETDDGNLIAAGETTGYGASSRRGFVAKFNSSGVEQWTRLLGDNGGGDSLNSVRMADNGDIILGGWSSSYDSDGNVAGWIIRMETAGDIEWTRTIGGSGYDALDTVIQADDGSLIAIGYKGLSTIFGGSGQDAYIAKLDKDGNQQWARAFGGSPDDNFENGAQTTDGTIVATGNTKTYGGSDEDGLIVSLALDGTTQWVKSVGGGSSDYFEGANATDYGTIIGVGGTQSHGGSDQDGQMVSLYNEGGGLSGCSFCKNHSVSAATFPSASENDHPGASAATRSDSEQNITPVSSTFTVQSQTANFVCTGS